jgi:hypothetical protein
MCKVRTESGDVLGMWTPCKVGTKCRTQIPTTSPLKRPLRAKKKIWYNFDNFDFVYKGGKAISAS